MTLVNTQYLHQNTCLGSEQRLYIASNVCSNPVLGSLWTGLFGTNIKMGLSLPLITLSVLLFGQVFCDINNDFDDNNNNNYFENGFNDDGLFVDSNDNFDDFNYLDDNNFFENRFDDTDFFDSDDSSIVRGGILGGSRAVAGSAGGSGSFTRMQYIPRRRHTGLSGGISAGVLGGGFNPISTRPMVLPRRLPKMLPMPKRFPRKMPMFMPRFSSGVGGIGGFPRFPRMGKYGGMFGGGRIPSFRRRRISAGIGGIQSRGFGKYFRHKMAARGSISGFPRKKIIKMY